jgi:hypothetical protein
VFIRELIPKYAVAAVARFAFNENYSWAPMSHRIEIRADGAVENAEYKWGSGPDRGAMARVEREAGGFFGSAAGLCGAGIAQAQG